MKKALHCILNGPIGVNKTTNFPLIKDPQKIKDSFKDQEVSNSSWRGFCYGVAEIVKRKYPDIDCSTKRKFGDLWPLAVDKFRKPNQ